MKVNKTATARKLLAENPSITTKELAKKLKIKENYAGVILWKLKSPQKPKKIGRPKKTVVLKQVDLLRMASEGRQVRMGRPPMRMMGAFISDKSISDAVNHPAHYKTGGIETIDFIEAKDLGYHLGNVVKYVTRADHKGNKLEDLKKAQWYLNRAIENLSKK